MTAAKIVAIAFGIIAAVVSYGFYNPYMFALLALIAAIATGVVVYLLAIKLLAEVL